MHILKTHKFSMRRASERGVALVLVLGMLVLLSGLLVAFLTTATTERTATQSASDGATARQLADTTVNLMIGQIREATSSLNPDGTVNEKSTWASQPGAIRTYSGQTSANKTYPAGGGTYQGYTGGSNDYVFKLYSADRVKIKASDYATTDLPAEVDVITKWDRSNPDPEYVDLNDPILSPRHDIDPSGETMDPRYPIIDPRARYTSADKSGDPGIVEGFDAKITVDNYLKIPNSAGTGAGVSLPYIPMPVKWLYILRDGTVGPASLAKDTNPIVGRTAFWSDDESCKLNINTSSEGTFWDTPSASTVQEAGRLSGQTGTVDTSILGFASSQPVRGEYQRYPGHPFTTCLSPVFGWRWNLLPNHSLLPSNAAYRTFKEAIYQISPYTPYGKPTTQGATWNSDPDATGNQSGTGSPWYFPKNGDGEWGRANPDIKTKHPYATVDELLFVPQRNSGGVDPKGTLNGLLTPQALEKTRFFLTATSRAPELNLFGRPRVTLWPVHANFDLRTGNDDLFAFASTIYKDSGGRLDQDKKFHLVRADAKSDTTDFTAFDNQNKKMYEYLQTVTGGGSLEVPSFGGSFLSKYGPDRDQILTEIFDYMRTVNLVDTGTASRAGNVFAPYTPPFFPKGIPVNADPYTRYKRSVDWSGQVTPLKVGPDGPDGTMGLGRFIVITEAALVFHRNNVPNTTPAQVGIQATLALEMASPMAGLPGIRETYFTKIRTVGKQLQLKLNTATGGGTPTPVEFCSVPGDPSAKLINIVNVSNYDVGQGRAYMPILGFVNSMFVWQDHKKATDPVNPLPPILGDVRNDTNRIETGGGNPVAKLFQVAPDSVTYKRGTSTTTGTVAYYPYVSKPLAIGAATSFNFIGPQLEVEIWTGEAPPGVVGGDDRARLVQTVYLDFPDVTANLPLPGASPVGTFGATRLTDGSADAGSRDPIFATDTVRSIELVGANATGGAFPLQQQGDMRLVAALRVVPAANYAPRGGTTAADLSNYYNSTKGRIHGLQRGHGEVQANSDAKSAGNDAGVFAAGAQGFINGKPPILPMKINGVLRSDGGPGDWDRGLSKHMDGAMGNKADEGNLKFEYTQGTTDYQMPYFRGRGIEETGQSFFSPNRQFPSAVMLGSLPTGVKARKPYQTLLFRPDREAGGKSHPGAGSSGKPPDHLFLDLFNMPVIEPFAISEPFSTMGKVNMNYVIAPFGYAPGEKGTNTGSILPRSYLRRDTALRGVLKSTWIMAVPTNQASAGHDEHAHNYSTQLRFPINLDKTIEELEFRMNDQRTSISGRGPLFRSASEICEIDLIPSGAAGFTSGSVPNLASWWVSQGQTGDNMRERPYAHIYPRLTTKSNVFTVYMRCQAIRKAPGTKADEFDPKKDLVVSEYRGSATVERFIDPNDQMLKDYKEKTERAEPYYRFRIVETKQFTPR